MRYLIGLTIGLCFLLAGDLIIFGGTAGKHVSQFGPDLVWVGGIIAGLGIGLNSNRRR